MKKLDNMDDKELRQEAPLFFGIEKRNNFEVPEGYFENLPHIIQERCVASSKRTSIWETMLAYLLQPRMALASVSLLLVAITASYMLFFNTPKTSAEDVLSLYTYELDESTLVESLAQDNYSTETEEEKEIDEYLINDNIDPSLILN